MNIFTSNTPVKLANTFFIVNLKKKIKNYWCIMVKLKAVLRDEI